jgi:hypothetical protein
MNGIVTRPEVTLGEDWMFLVFLFALVTLAYTRRFHPLRITRLWNSTWNVRILRQAIREEPNTPRANLLFNLSFFFQTALVVYLAIKFTGIAPLGYTGFGLYLLFVLGVMAMYLLKTASIRAVQMMADGDFGLTEYEYNVFLINRVIGLLLMPVNMLLAYLPKIFVSPFIGAAVGLYSMMIFYRMIRGFVNAAGSGVPVFYIFFYICTLEILPLAVGMRILLS